MVNLLVYTKAPMWWTLEEWNLSREERERVGIKLMIIKV